MIHKKICVVTSTRADYGLLKRLMYLIKSSKIFNLLVVATGSHLEKEYGYTIDEIINDGFDISHKIYFPKNKLDDISSITGKIICEFSIFIKKNNPDLVVLLGDRHEIFASAISAKIDNIPIAHIHGGEITPFCYDDSFRHAITKLANIHFVANKDFKKRVIQLGEMPSNVFIAGGLGLDSINKIQFLNKATLEKELGINFLKKNILVTYHPVTLKIKESKKELKLLLNTLKKLKNTFIIFTSPNIDIGSIHIVKEIQNFVKNHNNSIFIKSLGQTNYFSLLNVIDAVIGNSSSGILEVPSFKKATINIGLRQQGRPMAKSVINIPSPTHTNLAKAFKDIYSEEFINKVSKTINPYGKPGASTKIYNFLRKLNFNNFLVKNFYDLKK